VTSLRVLLVSHTYIAPINRAKLAALARRVCLTAIIPQQWRDQLFTLQAGTAEATAYALHQLPVRLDGRLMYHFYPIRRLDHILRQVKPELVYVEEEPASLALGQLAFLKRRHAYKLICFTWENIPRRVGLPGLEHYILQRCDGAIAGNREAAEVLHQKGFRGPVTVIPQLGLDPTLFQPTAHSTDEQAPFVVGYVGRMAAEKGVWTLLDAVQELPTVQLLLVGSGPLQRGIEDWIVRHGLSERIRRAASVPHEAIVQYVQTLDCLVLPSHTTPTWKEQFGHALIEAMACGVPVIGSQSGAIPDVIGDAGVLFPEGDAAALRVAIASLQRDPARRVQLGRAGRERVLTHYTHDRIAATNVEFFRQVVTS